MNNNLYNLFISEINSVKIDLNYTEFDFKFEHEIDFDDALQIRKTIFDECRTRYSTQPKIINDSFELVITNKFIDKLIINIICRGYEGITVNINNKNIILNIYCEHPMIFDFRLIRYALLVIYYQYLKQQNIKSDFVEFMENIGYFEDNLSINILLEFINRNNSKQYIDLKSTHEFFV